MELTDEQKVIYRKWLDEYGEEARAYFAKNNIPIHTFSPDQAVMASLRFDPVLFVRLCIGAEPQPWQAEFLRNVRDHPKVSVRSGTGVGKSTTAAWLLLWFTSTLFPSMVVALSTSEQQIKSGIWKEVGVWYRQMTPWMKSHLSLQSTKLFVKNYPDEAFAVLRTPNDDRPETLQGFHCENLLLLVDEASGIPENIFDALMGSQSSHGAKMVLLSNPTRNTGFFYNTHRKPDFASMWKRMHIPAKPEYSTQVTQDFVDALKAQYGEDDPQYYIRILGDFPLTDEDTVISRPLMEPALIGTAEETGGLIFWGLDFALSEGRDRNALTKRQGNTILEPPKTWKTADSRETIGKVIAEWNETPKHLRPAEICCDAIGLGGPIAQSLRDAGLPIREVKVSEKANNKQFARLRDELWFKARDWFKEKNRKFLIRSPKDREAYEELINELAMPLYRMNSDGKLKVESKDDLRKRLKCSPDLADSLILTFAGRNKYDEGPTVKVDTSWIV